MKTILIDALYCVATLSVFALIGVMLALGV